MGGNKKPVKLLSKMDKLREKLSETGLVLRGTITERNIAAGAGTAGKNYGPYYQWTFKKGGKTATVNLSLGQRKQFQKAIDSNLKAEAVLDMMRKLSREILDSSCPGVKRRKRK